MLAFHTYIVVDRPNTGGTVNCVLGRLCSLLRTDVFEPLVNKNDRPLLLFRSNS